MPVLAPRGKLFDRENRLVVDNYPSVSCFLVREQNRNVDADLPLIARGLHLDLEQLTGHVAPLSRGLQVISQFPSNKTLPPTSKRSSRRTAMSCPNLKRSKASDGFTLAMDLPAHLIGYVGEVSEEDLNQTRYARI